MVKERILRLQERLDDHSAFYIENPVNRRYLTNFTSSAGFVVVTRKNCFFFTDFRYFESAKKQVTTCEVLEFQGFTRSILPILKENGVNTLYLETNFTTLQGFDTLQDLAEGVTVSCEKNLDDLLYQMRMIKTREEIKCISQAQRISEETFDYILQRIEAGRSEIDIMLDMEFYLRKLGSQGVSFDFIVVSGKNSSLPHGVPTNKLIEKGDFVTMDFGAVVDGYHSDMTRTVAVGEISEKQKFVYDTVLQAKNLAIESISPRKICNEIDKIARDFIHNAGFEGCFGHGLGHSVGLEIHEDPAFNTRCETVLQPGMVLTVEPGIYLENEFGVRIEDMVVITKDGYTNLTECTDRLLVL